MPRFIPSPSKVVALVREFGALGPLAAFTVIGPAVGALVLSVTGPAGWYPRLAAADPMVQALVIAVGTVFLTGLSLVPTHAASLVAGMLFGPLVGPALALGSIGAAALFGYALVRRFVADHAIERLARRPRAYAVHQALLHHSSRRTILLVALIRLSPVMPFAATNLLMASSRVPRGQFLVGTILGIAPRVVAVAVAGAGLATLDLGVAGDRHLAVLGVVATLVTLAVATRIAAPVVRKVTREEREASREIEGEAAP
jgi:uncharacterized membrane protein YdjX (TVP38/TMEM64 family)